jgi:hypothetical protein
MEIGTKLRTEQTNEFEPPAILPDSAGGAEIKTDLAAPSLVGLQGDGDKPATTMPATLRGSGLIQPNSAKSGLEAWPRDLVQHLAQFLAPSETLNLASVSKTIRKMLDPYVRYYTARTRCRHIGTLKKFNEMLADDSGDCLPSASNGALKPHRGEVLVLLGERIPALPEEEQPAACKAFAAAASQFKGEKPENFGDLLSAAKGGIESLRMYLAHNVQAARDSIENGAHVGQVCKQHGIVDVQTRIELQRFAMVCPHISEALARGESARKLADTYGIDDSNVREDMRVIELMNTIYQ